MAYFSRNHLCKFIIVHGPRLRLDFKYLDDKNSVSFGKQALRRHEIDPADF